MKHKCYLLVPTVAAILPCIVSCQENTKPQKIVFSWEGYGKEVYSPDYEISDKEEISLSETFSDYSDKAENNDLMLAQDLAHTMSNYFSGNPSEKWQYAVKKSKIENDRISFSISIINSQSKNYELMLEVNNLLYTNELIAFEEAVKTLVFLPIGVEYDEVDGFIYNDDFWTDRIWTINEYEIEDGKIVEKNIINWEWVFSPVTVDILLDKLCYLTIYPHYFEETQILE